MIKNYQKTIALCVTLAFMSLLPVYSSPLPAKQASDQERKTLGHADPQRNFIEKEQQIGYQASQRNVLPILLGVAAAAACLFLLVMVVSKEKYDITGEWEFQNHYTTGGGADFVSVWEFASSDPQINTIGTYVRYEEDGSFMTGNYTIVNKKEVVFLNHDMSEQFTGQFDSKTTMSGNFVLEDGKGGTWTAKRK